ncbi:MAG: signal peptidase II [Clostridia bacterium]|nr:signal peptidase II [Clostridia bacterium]
MALVMILSAVIVIIDQVIKYFVLEFLVPVGSVTVIDNLLSLVYVENRGAAFGIFQNQVWIFAVITLLMIAVFVYILISGKIKGKLFTTAAILIIGGGIGNLIDRIFRGFVVDYLSLSFFPPVCNFADYCITIGAVLFIISIFITSDKKSEKTLKSDSVNTDKNNGDNNG